MVKRGEESGLAREHDRSAKARREAVRKARDEKKESLVRSPTNRQVTKARGARLLTRLGEALSNCHASGAKRRELSTRGTELSARSTRHEAHLLVAHPPPADTSYGDESQNDA